MNGSPHPISPDPVTKSYPCFGVSMARLRSLAGMTQHQLAEALNVSRSYIAAVESSRREPNLDLLRGLRRRFGFSVDACIDEMGD